MKQVAEQAERKCNECIGWPAMLIVYQIFGGEYIIDNFPQVANKSNRTFVPNWIFNNKLFWEVHYELGSFS